MMRRLILVAALMFAVALAGCPAGSEGLGGRQQPATTRPILPKGPQLADEPNGSKKPKRYCLVVSLRMVTIEVPTGTASGSEEIWSYLDEEPVQAVRSANLGRNGLRVGLGRQGSWPDLARIFKRMTGRSPKQNLVVAIPGDPLPIVLRERQGEQTIFTYHDDRTLSGKDYPPGDNLLSIVCTLDEDDLSKVLVTAMPQVRSTRRKTRFVLGNAGPTVLAQPVFYSFPDLTFQLTVAEKGFVVIGPGTRARNPSTVGHHLLVKKKEGMDFETILVLLPEVFAAPAN